WRAVQGGECAVPPHGIVVAALVSSMLRAIAVGLVAAALGCSSSAPGDVDGGVADGPSGIDSGAGDIDGPAGVGLEIDFVAAPPLPNVASGVSVDECRVWLRDLRVIGDAAPGDSRTSLAQLELDFEPGRNPPGVLFPQAPPGHYSQLAARLGRSDGSNSFQIRATVTGGGQTYELEIRDDTPADISVALSVRVENQAVAVPSALALSLLGSIAWSTAPHDDNNRIELDGTSPITATVRAALVAGFHAQ